MTDLSKLSDEELLALYRPRPQQAQAATDLSSMSTEELLALRQQRGGVVNNVTAGLNEAIAGAVGAPVDAANWLLGKVGVPTSPTPVMGADWLLNRMGDIGIDPREVEADSTAEKLARGAGKGVGDALSIAMPAGAVSQAARMGGLTQRSAAALAAQPGAQMTAGAVGGAVGEATDNPMLGMAAALAVPLSAGAARRVVSPVPMSLTPEEQRLAQVATRAGIQLTPGQATGSRRLQTAENVLTTLPFSGSRQQAVFDAQRREFNRAVLDRAGVRADRASPEVLDDAFRAIGGEFDRLARATNIRVDRQLFDDVDRVAQEYGRRLPTDIAPVFQSYVDDLNQMRAALPPPGGNLPAVQGAPGTSVAMDGDAYLNVYSNLRRAARQAQGRPELQEAINGLADALDGAMVRSAPADVAQAWQEARRQYRNLLMVDGAMAGGAQADRVAGNIPFGSLKQQVQRSDPRGFARGRGEMNDMARVGDFLSSKIPNSGTPERSMMTGALTGAPVTSGITAAAVGVDPLLASSTLLGYGVPPLVQAIINSPAGRAYLTNQLATGRGPTVNRALVAALLAGDARPALSEP